MVVQKAGKMVACSAESLVEWKAARMVASKAENLVDKKADKLEQEKALKSVASSVEYSGVSKVDTKVEN